MARRSPNGNTAAFGNAGTVPMITVVHDFRSGLQNSPAGQVPHEIVPPQPSEMVPHTYELAKHVEVVSAQHLPSPELKSQNWPDAHPPHV
jgi:hypothetical protein